MSNPLSQYERQQALLAQVNRKIALSDLDAGLVNEITKPVDAGDLSPSLTSSVEASFLRNIYRKSVVAQFPMRFPDYEAAKAAGGYRYLYPQAMWVDQHPDYREVLIHYEVVEGTDAKRGNGIK